MRSNYGAALRQIENIKFGQIKFVTTNNQLKRVFSQPYTVVIKTQQLVRNETWPLGYKM